MALVVLLRGVNVGGHRTFRPAALVQQLKHLDAVNIGAAGTFVIRKPVAQAKLRAELQRLLPFDTEVAIVKGSEILALVERDPFAGQPAGVVPFVSTFCKRSNTPPALPLNIPAEGDWLIRILERDGHFVCGVYRRDPKTIRYLGTLDRLFGAPVTTRNWNTINAIAGVLSGSSPSAPTKPRRPRKP